MHGQHVYSMRRFNHLHAKMRVVVENCFGRFKGRSSVLRMIYEHPDLEPRVQEVCVTLQNNFVEARDVAYEGEDEDVSRDASVGDVDWTASDQTAYVAGCVRRIEIMKALGLPWVEG